MNIYDIVIGLMNVGDGQPKRLRGPMPMPYGNIGLEVLAEFRELARTRLNDSVEPRIWAARMGAQVGNARRPNP